MKPRIARLGVVVPAHNEEHLLADCLVALRKAVRSVRVPVVVLVVLDGCTDGSRSVCQRLGAETLEINARNVGLARAAGFRALTGGEAEPRALWLASTDADTQVDPGWLRHQLDLADGGADVALGVIKLSGQSASCELRRAFGAEYEKHMFSDGSHDHVHGANLGMRASVYLDAGGFPGMANHEDRWLVQRLRRMPGVIIERSQQLIVSTSGRLEGRCKHGLAATLATLEGMGTP
jgi:glycosyltransferase involved in cell wall biosynthesis